VTVSSLRCAIYTRASVVGERDGVEAQHKRCAAFVRQHAHLGVVLVTERFGDRVGDGAHLLGPGPEGP
jgi:hypothetical protein